MAVARNPIVSLFHYKPFLILDGALATELEAHGYDLSSSLWSAEILIKQPSLIQQVHEDYFRAGADIAITASYQASLPGLASHGIGEKDALELIKQSVVLAKSARAKVSETEPGRVMLVAGSVGPYGAYLADGSEYRGDYETSSESLRVFHEPRIDALLDAGVDVLAFETLPSHQEAMVLRDILRERPEAFAWFSFTLRGAGHISDGTSLKAVLSELDSCEQVVALGCNCVSVDMVAGALAQYSSFTCKPLIAYPNSGEIWDAESKTWSGRQHNDVLAPNAEKWYRLGAKILGGCCRTTPFDIKNLAEHSSASGIGSDVTSR